MLDDFGVSACVPPILAPFGAVIVVPAMSPVAVFSEPPLLPVPPASASRSGWGRFGSLDIPPEMLDDFGVSACVPPILAPFGAVIVVPAVPPVAVFSEPPLLPVPPVPLLPVPPAFVPPLLPVPPAPLLPVPPAFVRHSAGHMTITCPHCSARFFADENVSCCAHGSVDLPLWRCPPEPLLSLLQDENFRLKIRGYNCALSLGSSVFDDLTATNGGPATFKMAGRSWHLLPHSVHPTVSGDHKTAQIYTLPVHEATERRVELTSGPRRPPLRRDWLSALHSMLLDHNALVRSFVHSSCDNQDWNVSIGALESPHAVAANETMVGLLINGGCERRSVVIPQNGSGSLVIVPDLDPFYQPLHFVLLFPFGDPQWGLHLHRTSFSVKRDRQPRVTVYDYLKYHLQRRSNRSTVVAGSNVSIHSFGRLFEEWFVDSFLQCENHKLRFLKQHQGLFRRDKFSSIHRQLFNSVPPRQIGSPATHLPSSFVRGYRFYRELYADAMVLPAHFGSIDYFLTFTTNPQWPEITANTSIVNGMNSPDLYCRVFYIKMKALLIDVLQHGVLGTVVAYAWSVEFQQRGQFITSRLAPRKLTAVTVNVQSHQPAHCSPPSTAPFA